LVVRKSFTKIGRKSEMNKIILFALLILCLSLVACIAFVTGQDAEAHVKRGDWYIDTGNPEQAFSEYNRAIEIDPQYADAYIARGGAYRVKGEFDKALADYDKAITINPNDGDAYLARAFCLMEIGENQRAISDLERASELGNEETARELLDELSQ
jgi:tetratricopeptide (TPR) repeat protein